MSALILIAEDHPASLELMRFLVETSGHRARVALDGEMALAIARGDRPDLIVCDLQMPVMNGYEVIRQVREDPRLRHVPVLAVTAYSMVGDRERVLAAGFDGYFSKPIAPEDFIRQVEAFLPPSLHAAAMGAGNRG